MLHLGKGIENRTWRTRYRGPIVLHASQTIDHAGLDRLRAAGYEISDVDLVTGAFIGEMEITGCVTLAEGQRLSPEWAWGPYCWTVAHPVAYEQPVPARGWLGLFRVEHAP